MGKQAKRYPRTKEHLADDGCSVHPRCLECPLPACRYDVPLLAQAKSVAQQMHARGKRIHEIADVFGVSARTIRRWLLS